MSESCNSMCITWCKFLSGAATLFYRVRHSIHFETSCSHYHSFYISCQMPACRYTCVLHLLHDIRLKQVAQLSQRDRAAEWVSYGQKWKTVSGRQYFTDIIVLSSTSVTYLASKVSNSVKKKQNKCYYATETHLRSSRSVSTESPYATSY